MAKPTGGDTLQDALTRGQGIERPFRCEVHEDTLASASVNVLKGVWYCHACHATGSVDTKKAPSLEALEAMMKPEQAVRVYPAAFLELYDAPVYWLTRFPAWVTHAMGLGEDPFTGDATFPVHTPGGLLAGVGRRKQVVEEKASRYLYPRHWSSGSTLFGTAGRYPRLEVLCLVEGAADATSLWEVGCPALAVYGSGLHMPQRELLHRYAPKLILLGFDMDDAGRGGVERAFRMIGRVAPLKTVYWPRNDPAACDPDQRLRTLLSTVARAGYGDDVLPRWSENVTAMTKEYERFMEDR
jgi:hypothetical protein